MARSSPDRIIIRDVSESLLGAFIMKNLGLSLAALLTASTMLSAGALADSGKPAVAAPNAKFDVSGGSVGLEAAGAVAGSVSLPLAQNYGIQIDAAGMRGETTDKAGAAFHIFRRDPASYLVGVTGMAAYADHDDFHQIYRTGIETEFYLGDVTVAPSAGYQRNFGQNWAYANLHAGYYVTDNLVLGAEVGGFSLYRVAGLDAEWQPWAGSPVSLFANVGGGNRGGGFGLAGVRFSFGVNGASLKEQHREYDPPNIVDAFASGAGSSAMAQAVKRHEEPAPVVRYDY